MSDSNAITILRPFARDKQARKTILGDGTIRGADNVALFRHETRTFESIEQLHAIVAGLTRENAFVVRGAPAADLQPIHRQIARVRGRGDNGFLDVPKRWLPIDIDGLALPAMTDWREDQEAAVEHAIARLPEAFWDASCSWSFTGSHGLERDGKRWTGGYVGDVVRLRLWFDLSRAIGSTEARSWLRSMGDMAPVDASVAGAVQPIYVARPVCFDGSDPLARLGVPLAGFRQGLEAVVQVPDDLAEKARWARAEGHGASCASHPSADAAIAGIGRAAHPGGRSEIRSHMMSAALHLARNERNAQREPKAEELHAAICGGIERHRDAIDRNLTAAGRGWGDVEAYTCSEDLLRLCAWACERIEEDNAKAQDGGGAKKIVRRVGKLPPLADDVVFVNRDEARAAARQQVADFVKVAEAHVPDTFPAPQRLLMSPTGGGKTHAAAEGVKALAVKGAVSWLVPNLALGDEAARRIREGAGDLNVVVRRGRDQPDPDQPGMKMCHRPDDAKVVAEHGLPVATTLCRFEAKVEGDGKGKGEKAVTLCPHYDACGYIKQKQALARADVTVMAHAHLFMGVPDDVRKPVAGFIDESAWEGAVGGAEAVVAVGLGLLTSPPTLIDGALRHYRKQVGEALALEPDGPVRKAVLAQWAAVAAEARSMEWDYVRKITHAITRLTGEALKERLEKALGGLYGLRNVKRMAAFWRAVEDAGELPDGARSGRLRLHTIDAETGARELRVAWKADLAEGWDDVPLMLLDATADVEVVRQVFTRIQPSPRYAFRNEQVKVRQVVDRALSHGTIVGPDAKFDPDGTKRKTAQRNAEKVLARLISDALERYEGKDVLAVVPLGVEKQWRGTGRLPSWLHLAHHGAVVGLDGFGSVRAVYVIGRPLPSNDAVERMAGALSGVAVEQLGYVRTESIIRTVDGGGVVTTAMRHRDPLAEAIRRQVTEAAITQAAGRVRAINRTADNPADIVLWTDVAVPDLGPVEADLWQGPSVDEAMLAKGAWFERAADASKAYRADLGTPQAIEDARKGSELPKFCLMDPFKQNLGTSLLTVRYRLARAGSGPAIAVFLSADPATARTFLEERLGPLALFEVPAHPPEAPQKAQEARPEVVVELPLPIVPEPSPAIPEPPPHLPTAPPAFALPAETWRGGPVPPDLVVELRQRMRATGQRQEDVAQAIGLSRPQLTNALVGRFGLSERAAERLKQYLSRPPSGPIQATLI